MEYPGCHLVTIAMDRVEFRKSVREGAVLRFVVERVKTGRTSVQYRVAVRHGNAVAGGEEPIFSTTVTFVRIEEQGRKLALPAG